MGNKVNEEAYGACNAIMRHKVTRAIKMSDTAFTYVCYAPIRALWKDAEAAFHDFQRVAHGMILRDGNTDAMADAYMAEYEKFKIFEQDIRNKLKYLKKKEVKNEIKKTKVPVTTMPKAAVLCQGELLCTPEASEATVRCQGIASESCLQAPGRAAPGESQPESAVQGQGGLCLPPGGDAGKEGSPRLPKAAVLCQGELLCTPEAAEAAKAAVLCQGGRMVASESCLQAPGRALPGEGQPEAAVQGQAELRMASEKLCMQPPGHTMVQWSEPSAGTVKGFKNQVLLHQSQNLVINHKAKPSKAEEEDMDNNGNEEAHTLEAAEAVLCQGELLCTPEAAEAAVLCQGRLLCTPEAAEAAVLCCVHKIFKGQAKLCLHSGGDAGKEGSPRLPKAAIQCQGEQLFTPEAAEAVLCQGELLCTPEAAKAAFLCQGRLLCTPEAAEATVLCQGRLLCTPEAAEAAVLFCVYKIFKGQAGLCLHSGGDVGEQLFTPEAAEAVLCQGELLCTPEAVEAAILCQAGLRMASERLCRPPPGHAGEGQPEAAVQGQAELRMASEKLCMQPPGHTMVQCIWSEPSAGTVKGFKNQVLLHQSQNLVYNHKAKPSKAEEEDMNNNGNEEKHTVEACDKSKTFMRSNAAQNQQPDAAVKGQAGLCLHSGGDAGKEGSPWLPKAAFQCQGELLCTPEAAEAAVLCQGRLLCTPKAAEATVLCCVYKIVKGQAGLCLHSGGDAGKEGSPRLSKAAVLCQGELLCTPEAAEAAVICQGGRMVASESCVQAAERLSMPRPGHAGGGQPEAAVQGRGRLCLPPGGDAGKEGSPGLPKAACQCQGEQLCTPEAAEAVLCQGKLLCTPEHSPSLQAMQTAFLKANEELNNNDRTFFVYNMKHFARNPSYFTTWPWEREFITTTRFVLSSPGRPETQKDGNKGQTGNGSGTTSKGHAGGGQPEDAVQGQDVCCLLGLLDASLGGVVRRHGGGASCDLKRRQLRRLPWTRMSRRRRKSDGTRGGLQVRCSQPSPVLLQA
jgi:hypothetical protein